MLKRKWSLLALLILLAVGMTIAGCGSKTGGDAETPVDSAPVTPTEGASSGDKDKEIPRGGTVTFSMYSGPGGQFIPILSDDAYTTNTTAFIYEGLVTLDLNLSWEPELAKDWYYENDNHTLVFELNRGVKWHDGVEFTAHDVKYTYEAIGHPDYEGVRRTTSTARLVGIEDYMAGEAEEITGLEVVDDYTIKFHFQNQNILALRDASMGIIPKHIFENIPVSQHSTAPESLDFDKLIGTGPFKATSDYLAGEYYVLERNEDYWKGAPYLDGVVWRVVNQDVAPGMLQSGDIDIITTPTGVRASDVEFVEGIPGVVVYEAPAFAYQYMGFKLAHRTKEDVDNNIFNPDNWIPNEKLQNVKLRQAIAYAIDRAGIVHGFLEGRGTVMNAHFPPVSWAYDESAVNTYPFNPEKAMELLDEAGYVDVTGDGWREDPNGNQLVIRLDYPTGNVAREQSAPYIQEALADVGIRVDLRSPRDATSHFDAIADDEPGMDLYLAGWTLGTSDPDPLGIWEITSPFNRTRWNDPKSQELLDAAIKTPEAFDQQYRADIYKEWSAYVSEQLPYIFLYSANNIFAYNSKIQNVIHGPTNIIRDAHLWYIEQ